jgi:hypothetical protein
MFWLSTLSSWLPIQGTKNAYLQLYFVFLYKIHLDLHKLVAISTDGVVSMIGEQVTRGQRPPLVGEEIRKEDVGKVES